MRRATSIPLAAALIVVLGALALGEGRARTALSETLAASAPDGVTVAPAGIALWGLVTGSIPVTLTVGAETIATALAGNMTEEQGTRIQGIRIDDYIYIDLIRATPIGEVPIEVAARPTVSGGALAVQIVSVTAGGFELPVSVLDSAGLSPDSGLVDSSCLTLRDARVEGNAVVLSADAQRGCR